MDSFYGNMVNLLNAQFQFDKFYPNKKAMDAAANTDDVFTGRHVLIEYDKEPENYFETEKIDFCDVYYPSEDEIKRFINEETHGQIYDYLFMNGKTAYFADPYYTKLYVLNYNEPVIKKNEVDKYCEIICDTGNIKIFMGTNGDLNKITVDNQHNILYNNRLVYTFNSYSGQFRLPMEKDIDYIIGYNISMSQNKFILIYCDNTDKNSDTPKIIYKDYSAVKLLKGVKNEGESCNFFPIDIGDPCYNKENQNIGIPYKEPEEIFIPCNSIDGIKQDENKFINIFYELTNEYDTNYIIADDKDKKIVENGPIHYKQLVTNTFDPEKDYYFCIPIANFEITNFETGENRKINEIIDNVFTNENYLYNFDNTFNYDLTIWRKGHELVDGKSKDRYREITGYKVPKLDYNLSPDTVLTATPDNKIKGKKLEGSGKIAVNFGPDEVVVSHEKSNDIVDRLGFYQPELKALNFPISGRTWVNTFDEGQINGYLTDTIQSFPAVTYYQLENIVVWISNTPDTHKITYTDDKGEIKTEIVTTNYIGEAIKKEGKNEPIKVGNEYKIFITNSVASYNEDTKKISFEGGENKGILYDPRIKEAFTIPYLEIDDYGHAIKTRNTQFVLPVVSGSNITYTLDDTIVNFAKQSGLATKLTNTIEFKIGNAIRNSSTGYTWTFEDMGFEGKSFEKTETLPGGWEITDPNKIIFYPTAFKLKNPISIKIGNQTFRTNGSNESGNTNEFEFLPENAGFINRKGDSGLGSLNFKSDSIISFGEEEETATKFGDEEIQAPKGYKIKNDNNIAFEMNEAGIASVNLNKIVLTGQEIYGTELPTIEATEGQIFFLIEETTNN